MLRNTEQRAVILQELRRCGHHPSAVEVYLRVKERLPRISLGTVYRNLELLGGQGIIGRLDSGAGQKRFDPVPEPHCHFRCVQCGKLEDLPFPVDLPELDRHHPWVREREVHGARPEYSGLCPECARQARYARSSTNHA